MSRVANATINLTALKHNFSIAKAAAPQSKVMAVIKANAYGHGILSIANALHRADALAVAHIEEATYLRLNRVAKRIIVLQGFSDAAELGMFIEDQLEPVVHNIEQIKILEQTPLKYPMNVWLKIDTGMHRLGVAVEEFEQCWQRLQAIPELNNNVYLMTHFANADDVVDKTTDAQIELFSKLTNHLQAPKSLANSAGILHWSHSHSDWIRPGIMLYGGSPYCDKSATELDLKPVMTLRSSIIAIKPIKKNERVGYGSTWTATKATNIAIVGIGYGDGYPRHVDPGTPVLINGKEYPIVGRVSMDMLSVDLGEQSEISIGDEVILWGEGLPADRIAQNAGTIAYELFCQVTTRVQFTEVKNG